MAQAVKDAGGPAGTRRWRAGDRRPDGPPHCVDGWVLETVVI